MSVAGSGGRGLYFLDFAPLSRVLYLLSIPYLCVSEPGARDSSDESGARTSQASGAIDALSQSSPGAPEPQRVRLTTQNQITFKPHRAPACTALLSSSTTSQLTTKPPASMSQSAFMA